MPRPIDLAVEHHRAGRLLEAERLYREVLVTEPDQPDALHLLGVLLSKLGRHEEAVARAQRAVLVRPDVPEYFNGLGNVLLHAGRVDEAIEAFRSATKLRPHYADAYSSLGNALQLRGLIDEALTVHARAAELAPNTVAIQNNHGVALRRAGRLEESAAAFRRAIEIDPNSAEAYNNLGAVLRNLNQLEAAIAAYDEALRLRPDLPETWTNWGNVQKDAGHLDEAIAGHARAVQLRPHHAEAYSNLAVALTSAGRLDDAIAAFRQAVDLKPNAADLHSNLVYTLHFHPDYDSPRLLAEHRAWAERFADPLTAAAPPHHNDRSPNRRLRVGYVSPDFRLHPVGRFLLPLLAHLDRAQLEVFCYSDVRKPDALTEQLRSHADHWRSTVGLSDEQLAAQIRADRIDVLVDLTMHMADNRMLVFARKSAPVQITWLAYTGTTGLAAMDCRLSDPHLDPPGGDSFYTERTIRLPQCFWCYEPHETAPEVNALPAVTNGFVTFGCFNNFCKVAEPALRLWAELLRGLPHSRLLLHSLEGEHREKVRTLFTSAGVSADRLEFVGFQPMDAFFRLHDRIDVALDPFPYGGGTTTCDALWMGVPVVTLAGRTAVGRAGVSLLSNVGLPHLIARTPEEYIAVVHGLTSDLPRLAELRSTLRGRVAASPLMDAGRFAADMLVAYQLAWRECARRGTR
jgi:predicted O-linked N-acetylglucosamine transferase (SPINDLY family)